VANLDPDGPLLSASSATLDLERYDDQKGSAPRAAGTFSATFGTSGIYSGTFNAAKCETLAPGCSASGLGAAAPLLLALLGVLRRRRYFFFVQRSIQPMTVSCH
jgi:uncharacterized protein (TIGR03382 family)